MSPNATKLLLASERLDEIHQAHKKLHGDRWEAVYQELAVPMEAEMSRQGITNPIEFVIPIAKLMLADRKDPSPWWAVAVEMCHRLKAQEGLPA